jgi:hypothetical protein
MRSAANCRPWGAASQPHNPQASIRDQHIGERVTKLTVTTTDATIKIEPNPALRGSVYPPESRRVCEAAQRSFEAFARVECLAEADLYGGKLCAALDRQHPRDPFDVKLPFEIDGITPEIRRAFVVYLAGHNRPMGELLDPNIKDISVAFETQFVGMTEEPAALANLVEIRRRLPVELVSQLDEDERAFLLSMKRGEPEWTRLGFNHIEQLPALQWKLQNIRRMDPAKQREMLRHLERILACYVSLIRASARGCYRSPRHSAMNSSTNHSSTSCLRAASSRPVLVFIDSLSRRSLLWKW